MALTDKDLRLIRLSTAIVIGDWTEVERVRANAPDGEPDRAWREAVLQVHLFAGVPRQVEAFEVLQRAGGLGAVGADEHIDQASDPEHGMALFGRIYGSNAERIAERLRGFHPDFGDWVLGHAYGRVLSRPGLGADRRELLAVTALAATGQDRQLASHARGALACGATCEEVTDAIESTADLIDPLYLERARAVAARFAC
ncbi:MAG: 4-carboxymuconolactone decarboxylase [Chlamydiales bacterium]|jgi:4-carboxymuconolactone decarboxylase